MEHFVEFDKYCSKCEHKKVKETDEPCNECIQTPVMEDSRKPLYFKSDEDYSQK